MILWHLGLGSLLVYVTLGRRRIDYRYVLVGAIVPDALDAAVNRFVLEADVERSVAHSLAGVLLVAVVIVVFVRGRDRRLAVFGLAVGWLTHLVLDAMWQVPQTFLWPAFGLEFAASEEPYSVALFNEPSAHIWAWAGEIAGAAALTWLWVAHRLGDDERLGEFLRDGYLRP